MGAIGFIHVIESTSIKEGFDELVAEAEMLYGREPYNGTISTCSLGRTVYSEPKYTKTAEKKAIKYVEDSEYGVKWEARVIDLGPVEYKVVTVKKENVKGTPKYKMKYVVVKNAHFKGEGVKSFDTKKQADDYAMMQALENQKDTYEVQKKYVLESGTPTTTEIVREVKTYKSKPKLKPMPNRKVVPIHKYVYYGKASC